MVKWHKLFYGFCGIIFIVSIASSFILFNLVINIKSLFSGSNTELTDIIIKTTSPLLGALLSGLIAILIFYLNKIKDEQLKIMNSRASLEIIKSEIGDNQRYSEELFSIITAGNLETIVEMLQDEKSIQEQFLIISTKFSTEIIDKTFTNLSKEDYLLVASEIKTIKMIISSLELLTTKIDEKDNKKALLERLKFLLAKLIESDDIHTAENYPNLSLKDILNNGWKNGAILTGIVTSVVIIIANYFLSK